MGMKKTLWKIGLIGVLFVVFILPRPVQSQIPPYTLQSNRSKIAVVPGGIIQFHIYLRNTSDRDETYLISSSLVNQTQLFSYRLLYQNKPIQDTIQVLANRSAEINIEVTTTQKMPVGAKGAIQLTVAINTNPGATKQTILLNFLLTKTITMIMTQNSSTVLLSDQDPVVLDVSPYIKGGRTFVPLRFIGESFGASVQWFVADKKIVYSLRNKEIILWIGKNKMISDGVEKEMDVPPEIQLPGRTFVPLRVISEELGATVEWNNITRQIKIIFSVK